MADLPAADDHVNRGGNFSITAKLRKRFALAETGRYHELVADYLVELHARRQEMRRKFIEESTGASPSDDEVFSTVVHKALNGNPKVARAVLSGQLRHSPGTEFLWKRYIVLSIR